MGLRVAVASNDGRIVNQHFGRTNKFFIFDIDGDTTYKFLEIRETTPVCSLGVHDDDALQKTIELLEDCNIVFVSRIGPGAEHALKIKGIQTYEMFDYIDNSLKNLASMNL
ncbi:nitrogenase iron-molybdenum cofactor biosynthesis protein NifB [Gottschalkia purinilytica]|uniref:Nitrogenase iron-molybdenum cofactor biosynthesis protein NifB n=1 Tax=Gottschalkia purinilytica TaxID=1503 RepID=A0A0L0WAU3_GOTPU|nr:NifB/NifX family molybdenum-iron cluster-binding protein [Gottschalkia purinilytica]KNF08649.1 nitrogenase iron-molybdenum cofactor biosynthesis protein NifB [Gottschalkia purinilytica]